MPQMFNRRPYFLAIYKGFHFGMEQLLAHCAMLESSIATFSKILHFACLALQSICDQNRWFCHNTSLLVENVDNWASHRDS